MWNEISRMIDSNHNFMITSHVHPDGDSIGSGLALCEFLRARGKKAEVVGSDATPVVYQWLDPDRKIIAPASKRHLDYIASVEAIFIVDVNGWERLGTIGDTVRDCRAVKAVIDHHPYHERIVPLTVTRVEASSTAELIYDLITTLGGPLTRRAADALYTGILTDTGSFRFANTSPVAHCITSKLLEAGVNPAKVYDEVYNQNSEARTRLMGTALSNISFAGNGQIAWLAVTRDMFRASGAAAEDTSGFVDVTMAIAGVEIGMIFVETEKGEIRISLRSRGNKDVNKVAVSLGGGGHRNASGVVLGCSMEEAVPKVTAAAVAAL